MHLVDIVHSPRVEAADKELQDVHLDLPLASVAASAAVVVASKALVEEDCRSRCSRLARGIPPVGRRSWAGKVAPP